MKDKNGCPMAMDHTVTIFSDEKSKNESKRNKLLNQATEHLQQ